MHNEMLTGGHRASASQEPRLLCGAWNDLLAQNADRVDGQDPYCVVTRTSAGLVVGPLVHPGETPCLRCLELMIDLGTLDRRFVPIGAATSLEAVDARAIVAGERLLPGQMYLIDEQANVIASVAVARFSNCVDCRPARQPAEVHCATQLFRKEIG